MAMTSCAECKREISTKASACPGCGAKPRKSKVPLILLISAPVLIFAYTYSKSDDPAFIKNADETRAIELCWKEQARKSITPEQARFIAGSCEMMEQKYFEKHGRRP